MTEELFQKFIDGLCGISEREEVENWLNGCTDEELDAFLKNRWNNVTYQMPAAMSATLLSNLFSTIQTNTAPVYSLQKRLVTKRGLAVACSIAVLLCTCLIWKLQSNRADHQIQVAAKIIPANNMAGVVFNNTTNRDTTITLPDHSEVELYSRSSIRLAADYNVTARKIYLKGKAIFSVAKDKSRPFTVYSRDIATRAVGTRFMVSYDSGRHHIDIHLYEGVIEVKSNLGANTSTQILHPGEELHFGYPIIKENSPTQQLAESNTAKAAKAVNMVGSEISFINTPLSEVFSRLQELFPIRIEYDRKDLKNMTLTSSVSKTDDPESLLNMISRMHGLVLQKTDSGFIVKRPGTIQETENR